MRLNFVEVCGFRGFRDKVRIDFGSGFTVISGRNGVGKSTLCDAVEFAITGEIDKYAVDKAAKESLRDYLWWRGEGMPTAHYVTVAFTSDDGKSFVVTRTRESGSDRTHGEIESALCSGPAPDDALRQLAKTSIIRDEWIAALSLDLTETERFELVRAALGPVEGAELGVRAKDIAAAAEATHSRNEAAYETARNQLSERLAQQSEAQDILSRSGDIAAAMEVLVAETPNAPTDVSARLAAGRTRLAAGRSRLGPGGQAVQEGRAIAALRQAFDAPNAVARREAARGALAEASGAKADAERIISQAEQRIAREELTNAVATSLALLVEHGERLGLHDDHCPLCAAARTSEEYETGLAAARARVAVMAAGIADARQALVAAQANAKQPFADYDAAAAEYAAIEQQEALLVAREQAHIELFDRHGLDHRFVRDPEGLERELATQRDRLIDLERALLTLEASQAVSRIAALEDRIASLRAEIDKAADLISRSQAAVASARAIERAVKRVSAEIIDERLAQISPLLNELYQRLRPHADWRTIDYSIRGDVRRFLSLKVGDGLNPQFVFSSGQRRAAGLAFLLSVHLARAWTHWRTLLLDDPVQHIDDFRALQLVEVLAAFRLDGRQLVCVVEDASLADLLCRRLFSTSDQTGWRYNIDIGSEGAAAVTTKAEILPLPLGVLRRGSELHVVAN